MKKLAIALAGALLLTAASPVFACPHDEDKEAPKTAEKDKSADKDKDAAKVKTADKAKAKDTTTAKKTDEKKPAKVTLN